MKRAFPIIRFGPPDGPDSVADLLQVISSGSSPEVASAVAKLTRIGADKIIDSLPVLLDRGENGEGYIELGYAIAKLADMIAVASYARGDASVSMTTSLICALIEQRAKRGGKEPA
jgi:hypothetical protein